MVTIVVVVVVVMLSLKPVFYHGFLLLGVNKLGVKKFQVKIGLNNEISITMFKKLRFQEVRLSHVRGRGQCRRQTGPRPCVCV